MDYDLKNSRNIGDAARLAVSIRRIGEISVDKFGAISTILKVDYRVAESSVLGILEDLQWVDIKRDGRTISKVIEQIPPSDDILAGLGKYWREQKPTEIKGKYW